MAGAGQRSVGDALALVVRLPRRVSRHACGTCARPPRDQLGCPRDGKVDPLWPVRPRDRLRRPRGHARALRRRRDHALRCRGREQCKVAARTPELVQVVAAPAGITSTDSAVARGGGACTGEACEPRTRIPPITASARGEHRSPPAGAISAALHALKLLPLNEGQILHSVSLDRPRTSSTRAPDDCSLG